MSLKSMSREQWGKIFDHWYRYIFNIGMHAEGPPHDLVEECFGLGVSPAEAVARLKNQGIGGSRFGGQCRGA